MTWSETQHLRGPQVGDDLEFGRRLHRHVGRLFALENAIDGACRAVVLIDRVGRIGDQAPFRHKGPAEVHRR